MRALGRAGRLLVASNISSSRPPTDLQRPEFSPPAAAFSWILIRIRIPEADADVQNP